MLRAARRWIAIVAIIAIVQVIRGETVDAIVFGATAVVLAIDAVAGPRVGRGGRRRGR